MNDVPTLLISLYQSLYIVQQSYQNGRHTNTSDCIPADLSLEGEFELLKTRVCQPLCIREQRRKRVGGMALGVLVGEANAESCRMQDWQD